MSLKSSFLIFALLFTPVVIFAEQVGQPLFKIERNTNANIVQYDAQLGPDGKLYKKEPVVAYWIRLADQGQVMELSWIQKKFAYGFSAKYDKRSDSVTVDMAADIGRLIKVLHRGDSYQATTKIDGKPSRIVTIFIHATGKGMSTTVDYIELNGTGLDTGEETYERFVP